MSFEDQAKALFRRHAEQVSLSHIRRPIDFTCSGTPRLSVVMPLHNQFALTLASLSLLRQTFAGDLDVVLVDSGSVDHTIQLDRYVRGATLLRFETNIGFVRACSAGLEQTRADAVLYLNNDVLLAPGAVDAALARSLVGADIGAVGGKVIRSHGHLQEAGCIIWQDGSTMGYLRDAWPMAPEANFVRDVDYCSGVCLMVRGALVRYMGGFDLDYAPAYYEDVDLCVRLHRAGYRVVYRSRGVSPARGVWQRRLVDRGGGTERAQSSVFTRKHADWLARQFAHDPETIVAARSRGGAGDASSTSRTTCRCGTSALATDDQHDIVATLAGRGSTSPWCPCIRVPPRWRRSTPTFPTRSR